MESNRGFVKKYLQHPIYWIRYGLSRPVFYFGLFIYDVGVRLASLGNRGMSSAVAIEGSVPNGAW